MRGRGIVRNVSPVVRSLSMRAAEPPVKQTAAIYRSPEWRSLVATIVAQRGRICEDPHCDGRTHRRGMRVFADHVIELKDGGPAFDPGNIMLRCGASHSLKTARVRAARMAQRY